MYFYRPDFSRTLIERSVWLSDEAPATVQWALPEPQGGHCASAILRLVTQCAEGDTVATVDKTVLVLGHS